MDADEMRHHLSGAASTTGQSGPAGGEGNLMQALSVVSTDVGQLREQVKSLDSSVEQVPVLQSKLSELTEKMGELHEAVQRLSGQEEKEPPPQPWDWASMDWEEELVAVATLASWVETHLTRWWPRVLKDGVLPPCWMQHPDMLRSLSLVYVSYQQAYAHPQRRVHHEVDFRRTLEDMLRDISTAAKQYQCGDAKKHITRHGERSDRTRAADHIRRVAAVAAFDADQSGDAERTNQIMEKFSLRPEDLREQAKRSWPGLAGVVTDQRATNKERATAARAAAHLLDAYQVIDSTDLRQAPDVGAVLHLLHEIKDDRFAVLRQRYEALVHKFATIRQEMTDLRPVNERGRALMERHGITEQDVAVVFDMLTR